MSEQSTIPLDWLTRPWTRVHLDFAGPFLGFMYLVLVDATSKWLEVHPMQTITASKTIEVLRSIFATHGLPRKVVTDNGPTFTSNEFGEFMSKNGIRHITRPQIDLQKEVSNHLNKLFE